MSSSTGSVTEYIDKRWELDGDKHRNVNDLSEKKRFAYRIWREDFERNQKREDAKESEVKEAWTQIYQLIGFDNVFQGVWFQGVTQLAAQRGCHFSIIPIILSVFASLATIVGVYLKVSKLQALEGSLYRHRIYSKGLQKYISECELEGVNFDFDTIEAAVTRYTSAVGTNFDEALVASRFKRNILLVSLTIASILFAWFIYLIMCRKYF